MTNIHMPWEEPLPYPNTVSGNGGTDAVVAGRTVIDKEYQGYDRASIFKLQEVRQLGYEQGYKDGSKVSDEARKAFYQQGWDEGYAEGSKKGGKA